MFYIIFFAEQNSLFYEQCSCYCYCCNFAKQHFRFIRSLGDSTCSTIDQERHWMSIVMQSHRPLAILLQSLQWRRQEATTIIGWRLLAQLLISHYYPEVIVTQIDKRDEIQNKCSL